ncbi:winged-helix domain-containing protein [Rhodococcus sp. NPDC056960]|uniref:winged helix-turn-helix transcriptional regulator n=1 Tax=Rhodococcus sp. NPDC056960 TaxID=3345982 RepID=UPI00363A8774
MNAVDRTPPLPSLSPPDIAVIDVRARVRDGPAIIREIRAAHPATGIVALGEFGPRHDENTARFFDAGADDCLDTTVCPDELKARLRALLRRIRPTRAVPTIADLTFLPHDPGFARGVRTLDYRGRRLTLTRTEYELMRVLVRNAGRVVSREQLLRAVWGYPADARTNVLNMCVSSLRRKLEDQGQPRVIHTVRRIGFVLRPET